ncbi:MAG: multiple sugar transport system permease protein [Candidatus Atribacteria bacterium]|nr:multiple sugar transport system permease protein [Candidatus Atribacteria bacterium]
MKTSKNKIQGVVFDILIGVVVLFCLFPFLWMFLTSFKTRVQTIDPSVWIFKPTLENYQAVFQKRDLLLYIKNSAVVVSLTTLTSLFLGTLTAYGLARFNFSRKEDLAYWILSLRMLPPMAVVIPFFLLGRFIGLLDTHILLVIVYLSFNIPFTIWMMRGFIEDIPRELEEAAWVDGCSRFQAIWRIIFPLVAPGLAATAIFCVIQSWNEFALAFFLTSFNARTVPTTVTFFLSVLGVIWGEMAAVGVIATLPVLIFALIVQKYLVRGLTFGAIKS